MVLRALGMPPAECTLDRLRSLLPPKCTSVWTVDLAYAMRHYGVRFRFLTTTVGVDPAYEAEPFYRATLDSDTRRVNDLFAQAPEHGVVIEHRSLTPDELNALLLPAATAIAPSELWEPCEGLRLREGSPATTPGSWKFRNER